MRIDVKRLSSGTWVGTIDDERVSCAFSRERAFELARKMAIKRFSGRPSQLRVIDGGQSDAMRLFDYKMYN